jgi:hypothetical protein
MVDLVLRESRLTTVLKVPTQLFAEIKHKDAIDKTISQKTRLEKLL